MAIAIDRAGDPRLLRPNNQTQNYTTMKKLALSLVTGLMLASTLVSCAGGPNAQQGTVIGALGGAAVGGIIGNQSGRGLEGAAIGAGLGGLAGNAIGDSQDRRYYRGGYPRYYR